MTWQQTGSSDSKKCPEGYAIQWREDSTNQNILLCPGLDPNSGQFEGAEQRVFSEDTNINIQRAVFGYNVIRDDVIVQHIDPDTQRFKEILQQDIFTRQADLANMAPLPVISHTPITPELYELRIQCPANPEIPAFIVEKLRFALAVGGYDLANVATVPEGYTIQVSKHGSITLTAAAVIVIGILALLAVGVIAYTWVRLSTNSVVEANSNNSQTAIAALTDLRANGKIDEQTFKELTQAVLAAYKPGETPGSEDGGFFGGIDAKTAILGAAVLLLATRR